MSINKKRRIAKLSAKNAILLKSLIKGKTTITSKEENHQEEEVLETKVQKSKPLDPNWISYERKVK